MPNVYGVTLSPLEKAALASTVWLATQATTMPLRFVKLRQQMRIVDTDLYETLRAGAGAEGMLAHFGREIRHTLQHRTASLLFRSSIKLPIKRALCNTKDSAGSPAHFARTMLYTAVWTSITSLILLPLDFASTRQAVTERAVDVEFTSRAYSSFGLTVGGTMAFRAAYYILHHNFKDTSDSALLKFLRGFAIVQGAALVTYPVDTLRRRVMLRAAASGADGAVSGEIDEGPNGGDFGAVLADVCASDRPLRDLYRGVWASALGLFAVNLMGAFGVGIAQKLFCRTVYVEEVSFYLYKKNLKRHARSARKKAHATQLKAKAHAHAQAQAQAQAAAAAAEQQAIALNNTTP